MIITREAEFKELRSVFLGLTGYGNQDILVFNPYIRTFMTRNGGVYELTEERKIKWVKGPPWEADERL